MRYFNIFQQTVTSQIKISLIDAQIIFLKIYWKRWETMPKFRASIGITRPLSDRKVLGSFDQFSRITFQHVDSNMAKACVSLTFSRIRKGRRQSGATRVLPCSRLRRWWRYVVSMHRRNPHKRGPGRPRQSGALPPGPQTESVNTTSDRLLIRVRVSWRELCSSD